ncbi:hypothetical protein FQN57_004193 [Myotisia sp. PD_48]|nr:hypothetical protein FQN57_004193 [Myotisia sp. PD_48]
MAESKALHWTLRFKQHNITVLLLVPPAESFASIKETLLTALKSRGIHEINGKTVPEDSSEIEFGFPVDRHNLEKGWRTLDQSGLVNGKKSDLALTPRGADLKDFQAVAFRFRKVPEQRDQTDEDELARELEDPGWDVMVPAYEDDDENEQTEG